MFQSLNDRTTKIMLVVIAVLIMTIIVIMVYMNHIQEESTYKLRDSINQKMNMILNKPQPKIDIPKCPELPKYEPPKCPEVKIPPCPKCPEYKKNDINIPTQKCHDCPKCPDCPKIDTTQMFMESKLNKKECPKPKKCPKPKECPPQNKCLDPLPCPKPRDCPPVRIVQKPCPRSKSVYPPAMNEIINQKLIRPDAPTGDLFPFSELKEMCPIKNSRVKSKLSYSSFGDEETEDEDDEVEPQLPFRRLEPRGIQTEEDIDILQRPLINADFTGDAQFGEGKGEGGGDEGEGGGDEGEGGGGEGSVPSSPAAEEEGGGVIATLP